MPNRVPMPTVVFRADGSASIGVGHISRCLALASAFIAKGWSVGFAATAETFAMVPALAAPGVERFAVPDQDDQEAAALAGHWPYGTDVLVVDHYWRDARFERACRPWARQILVIDDLANRAHDADVLVDAGASSSDRYRSLVQSGCRIQVGPAHALVRPEFLEVRDNALAQKRKNTVERVLISFGFAAEKKTIWLALEALVEAQYAGAIDVVGANIGWATAGMKTSNVLRFHEKLVHMPIVMANADLGIGSAGVTAWERCCLGLPSLIVTDAENQRNVAERISDAGAGLYLGPIEKVTKERFSDAIRHLLLNDERRLTIARAAAQLVDGCGAARVFAAAVEKS
jgi:UDP-2,4-diacetamido-2,4,6-trideoxy-beta-L-altropyranose hydrolase